MKNLFIFFTFILLFWACNDTKTKQVNITLDNTTTPPSDVPISKSDSNLSIDKDFPPLPVTQ